jgi:nucleoside-diphosphate-sugar epimerase
MQNTALVVGANGVIGGALAAHLAALPEWEVVGLSRRGGPPDGPVRHVAADLFDSAGVREALRAHPGVTHVFYAAYQDRPTWSALVEPNVAMLRSVLDAVASTAPDLRHVSLRSSTSTSSTSSRRERPIRAGRGRPSARRSSRGSGSATR